MDKIFIPVANGHLRLFFTSILLDALLYGMKQNKSALLGADIDDALWRFRCEYRERELGRTREKSFYPSPSLVPVTGTR
jgi:hypothetical protein